MMEITDMDDPFGAMAKYIEENPGQEKYTFEFPDALPKHTGTLKLAGAQLAIVVRVPIIINMPDHEGNA
jgi:hypothetical protein